MFAMSVNDVPGWLVTIPPSVIGVPVATTPGLVPHCDALTTAGLEVADELADGVPLPPLGLGELLQLASANIPTVATSTTFPHVFDGRSCICTCLHLLVVTA
jgi:hypothetical protein